TSCSPWVRVRSAAWPSVSSARFQRRCRPKEAKEEAKEEATHEPGRRPFRQALSACAREAREAAKRLARGGDAIGRPIWRGDRVGLRDLSRSARRRAGAHAPDRSNCRAGESANVARRGVCRPDRPTRPESPQSKPERVARPAAVVAVDSRRPPPPLLAIDG